MSHLSKARSLTRIGPSGVAKDTNAEPIKHVGDKGHEQEGALPAADIIWQCMLAKGTNSIKLTGKWEVGACVRQKMLCHLENGRSLVLCSQIFLGKEEEKRRRKKKAMYLHTLLVTPDEHSFSWWVESQV